MGGEGEGEGAYDRGLDSALEVEELAGRRRARGSGRDEAGGARDVDGADEVAEGGSAGGRCGRAVADSGRRGRGGVVSGGWVGV